MMKRVPAVILIPIFQCVNANAQVDPSVCAAVITKNVFFNTRSDEFLNYVYEKNCGNTSTSSSSGGGLGIKATIDAIPGELTGHYENAQQGMQNFCNNYKSRYQASSTTASYSETVVPDAYTSFDQCVALAARGIEVRPEITDIRSFDIYISPAKKSTLLIKGIKTPPAGNVHCSYNDPKATFNKEPQASMSTSLALHEDDSFNMACTRKGTIAADGGEVFEKDTILVMTDAGDYATVMGADTIVTQRMASVLTDQIKTLQAHNEDLGNRLVALEKDAEALRSGRGATVASPAMSADVNDHNTYTCPPGSYVTALTPVGRAGGKFAVGSIQAITMTCSKLGGF